MEALIILIAEAIMVPIAVFLGFVLEALVTAISAVFEFIIVLLRGRSWKKTQVKEPVSRERTRIPWLRKLNIILLALLSFVIISALIINNFFFESAARFVLDRVKARTNIEVTFSTAEGNIFSGKILLKDAELKRKDSKESNFNIKAGEFYIDLDMGSIFSSQKRIEEFRMKEAKGDFERSGKTDRMKTRDYVISNLYIESLDLLFSTVTGKGRSISALIEIEKLRCSPLRSKFAVFDVLFRSNISGAINDHPFSIKTKGSGKNRETAWKVKIAPLDIAAVNIGGPLKYISGGSLEVDVLDQWKIEDKIEIHMDWLLKLKDIEIKPPEDMGIIASRISNRVIKYLDDHKEMSFRFGFDIEKNSFIFTGSIQGMELWKRVGKILLAEIGKRVGEKIGEKKEKIKEYTKEKVEKAKEFLKKRRREKD